MSSFINILNLLTHTFAQNVRFLFNSQVGGINTSMTAALKGLVILLDMEIYEYTSD